MTYTDEEALGASVDYFEGDELAASTFVSKYALRDDQGSILELTPEHMHRRLAKEFARIEEKYPNPLSEAEIFGLFDHFRYVIPQGSPMSAIGNSAKVQSLSNCFVIAAPLDSYGSIARADEEILQIQKRRGGVGVDISNIRPRGLPVKNAAGKSDGLGIFMERFSNTTREVAQDGRRGALIETLDIRHPDVETFIDIKRDLTKVTGANVSIRFCDEFMEAVERDAQFTLRWPVTASPEQAVMKRTINARDLWKKVIDAAWTSAEPGGLFWDTILRMSMSDEFADKGYRTVTTNPCAELPLSEYCSCRLMLLNSLSYVVNPFTPSAYFDYFGFAQHVTKTQRLMDDLVDLELEAIDRIIEKVSGDPEPSEEKRRELKLWEKIKKSCFFGRRTGTGVTAVGDAMAALNLRYGSKESIETIESIYKTLAISAHASSVAMAKERGAFPAWESGRYKNNAFAARLRSVCTDELNADFDAFGRRNIGLTTTAPAGSVSILSQTTSGIECVIFLEGIRRKKVTNDAQRVDFIDKVGDKWQEYRFKHRGVSLWSQITGKTNVEESPYWGSTSADIDWEASVDVLAAAQHWCEHSISKTINLPADATRELVEKVYFKAWKEGVKGITVYRDGARSGVIVAKKNDDAQPPTIVESHAPKRPKELKCDVHRVSIKGKSYLVLVGMFNDVPYEVFAGLQEHVEVPRKVDAGVLVKNGKNKDGVVTYNLVIPYGNDDSIVFKDIVTLFNDPEYGALTRMVSLSMRHGVPVQYLVEQLRKDRNSDFQSFSVVLARVLKKYIKDGTPASSNVCPDCGGTKLVYTQGCVSCSSCSWSKCE